MSRFITAGGHVIHSVDGNPIGQPFGKRFDLYRAGITGADTSSSSLDVYDDSELTRMTDVLVVGNFTVAGSVTLKFFNEAKDGDHNIIADGELQEEEKTFTFDVGQSAKQVTINHFGGARLKVMVSSFDGAGSIDIYLKVAQ